MNQARARQLQELTLNPTILLAPKRILGRLTERVGLRLVRIYNSYLVVTAAEAPLLQVGDKLDYRRASSTLGRQARAVTFTSLVC